MKAEDLRIADAYDDNCAPFALTAIAGRSYSEVHEICEKHGWKAPTIVGKIKRGGGMSVGSIFRALTEMGFDTKFPKGIMSIGTITLKHFMTKHMDRSKTYLLDMRGHVAAVVNGKLYDAAALKGGVMTRQRSNAKVYLIYEVFPKKA